MTLNAGKDVSRGTIALTGGTGFIGGALIDHLTTAGWRVKALTRRANALQPRTLVHPVLGHLADESALTDLVEGADAVIHCAGTTIAASKQTFHAVNALGTAALARAVASKSPSAKFILISSLAARSPEVSAYGASKHRGEDLMRDILPDLDWQIIRPPAVYGPGDTGTLMLFKMFRHGWAANFSPKGKFSLIHVTDLAAGLLALLEAKIAPGQIFELDDGHLGGHSWSSVVDQARQQFSRNIRVISPPTAILRAVATAATALSRATGKQPFLTQDKINELIYTDWVCRKNMLGGKIDWKPKIFIAEGFSETVEWYIKMGWI